VAAAGAPVTAPVTDPTAAPIPKRNRRDAEAFLQLLGGGFDARFTFQTFDDSPAKRKELAHIFHGTFADRADELRRANDDRAGVFVTVNETDGAGRMYSNVKRVRALFVDLDGAPLQPILEASAAPHIIVESSSDRWHAYWLVSDCALEQFRALQKGLIAKFGGDKSIHDLPRVMRVPGFIHAKGAAFCSRIHQLNERPTYAVTDLVAALALDTSEPERARAAAPARSALTSSETDILDDLRDALRAIPSDDYDVWIRIGMALKTMGEAAASLWIEWSSKSPKFDMKAASDRWTTFRPEQTDHRVVFAEAKRFGWDPRKAPSLERRRTSSRPEEPPRHTERPADMPPESPTQEQLAPDKTPEGLVSRFELIYGTRSVWDTLLKMPMGFNAFADMVGRDAAKAWLDGGKRRMRMGVGTGLSERKKRKGGKGGDGGSVDLVALTKVDDMLPRYALVYGYEAVFDHQKRMELTLGALRAYCGLKAVRDWGDHPRRQVVDQEQVVFNPRRPLDDLTICNLWGGWPTEPAAGTPADQDFVDRWLKVLHYVTGESEVLTDWILKWIAYPLRYPGAKLTTSIIMHGPEGSGKNTIWNAVRRIYGRYGIQIMQTQLEQQWCDWISAKLFIVGNEVLHRQEQVQQKGRLKTLISDPTVRVERKFLPGRQEENFANMVFLSNELQPLSLDEGDRRFLVIWTPPPHPDGFDFYRGLGEDTMPDSAVQALYHYLLTKVELADFSPHTKPPMTEAKQDLIEASLESQDRFVRDWLSGTLPITLRPCKSQHLYRAYLTWCRENGERFPKPENKFAARAKKVLRGGVRWYADHTAGTGRRQCRSYVPVGMEPGAEEKVEVWLGQHFEAFRDQLQGWLDAPL
jgi:hypothetical protein